MKWKHSFVEYPRVTTNHLNLSGTLRLIESKELPSFWKFQEGKLLLTFQTNHFKYETWKIFSPLLLTIKLN